MKLVKITIIGVLISLIVPVIKTVHLFKKSQELEMASEVVNWNESAMPIEVGFTSQNVGTTHIAYWSNPYPAFNFLTDFLIGIILYSIVVLLYKQIVFKTRMKRMN